MNLSQLATAARLDLVVADVQGAVKYTVLPAAKPRRSQLVYTAATVSLRGGKGSQKVG
jgi:hypothetical protein